MDEKINRNKKSKVLKPAMIFILFMGIVSMFSDMTHEGARSIYGAYLGLAGASAATIGFVTGFGEFIGYSFRLVTGFIADKSKKYWTMTLIGYAINMLAIPALAFVSEKGWIIACILIVAERVGKAIRQPSKNTLVSFAASQVGEGKSFAILEFLDQIGAFIGPMILFLVLLLKKSGDQFSAYSICFGILGIPALLTLVSLWFAKSKYPHPENFEPIKEEQKIGKLKVPFIIYLIGSGLFALGFIDFPLITMHLSKTGIVPQDTLPLFYAGAMLVDAFSALFFGWLYDKFSIRVLMLSTAISTPFALFIFGFNSLLSIIVGVIIWGIGMGAQESILKSAVTTIVPKESRSTGFGIFETSFGICWFLGSWLMGVLYDFSILWMIFFSMITQFAAVVTFYFSSNLKRKR